MLGLRERDDRRMQLGKGPETGKRMGSGANCKAEFQRGTAEKLSGH